MSKEAPEVEPERQYYHYREGESNIKKTGRRSRAQTYLLRNYLWLSSMNARDSEKLDGYTGADRIREAAGRRKSRFCNLTIHVQSGKMPIQRVYGRLGQLRAVSRKRTHIC